ncbi:MAG: hypothetical protein QOJ00_532 [Actinomycetota bacterium]
MNEPRITPGARHDVGLVAWAVSWVSGRVSGRGPPNLFLTVARHRRLFFGWLHFAGRLMPGGRLPRRDTELVILRVAHTRRCAYEIAHHAHLARRAGLDAAAVERVAGDGRDPAWSARQRTLLVAVDELLANRDLHDDTWRDLGEFLDDRQRIELLLLVGHYDMLATFANTLRVASDERR